MVSGLAWGMRPPELCEFDQIVFDHGSVCIGAFRCHPSHPSFQDSGAARTFCFVFPRTAVQIQHEHEAAFVANSNVVTFYNRGQAYLRQTVSPEGDRCDWFGVESDLVRDVVRTFDRSVDNCPEMPFRFTRAWSDTSTYLLQRTIFERVVKDNTSEPLAVEEAVVGLLEAVVRAAYRNTPSRSPREISRKQLDVVRHIEMILSSGLDQRLTLRDLAAKAEISVYHLCRLFHQATGKTLHQYRQNLRLRWALENLVDPGKPLVDIALDAGFSSHSHFTSIFRREFSHSPSELRARIEGQRAIF